MKATTMSTLHTNLYERSLELAAGTPVIAYDKAGTRDIVQDGVSGVMFSNQTVDAVAAAIEEADKMTFPPATLQRKAKRFERSMFVSKIRKIVHDNTPL